MTRFRLRGATLADRDALITFNADVLRYQDAAQPDQGVGAWTADLLDGRHPQVGLDDFCLVEDARIGRIASVLCLISQTWSYGGIPLAVGQPELVGTHPDFRGQGHVRRLFRVLHQRSAARGQQVQAIDGIPGFYQQFGYGMALALHGEMSIDVGSCPSQATSQSDRFRVRAATEADLAFIADTDTRTRSRYLVTVCRDASLWHYELDGRSARSQACVALAVVEAHDGSRVGFLVHTPRLSGTFITLLAYEIIPSVSWGTVTPSVLRYLRATGGAYAASGGTRCERIGLCLGSDHPAYATLQHLTPRDEGAWAWQLRVVDFAALLRHIAPVLQDRLARSDLAGHSGALHLSFYGDGVRLSVERGRLTHVTRWRVPLALVGIEKGVPSSAGRADASFPGHTFLQLLFGYRTLDELQYAFPDCLIRTPSARPLLMALFPKQPSEIRPVL